MKMISVKSSNIASVGWEPGPVPWSGTMEVEFTHGGVYRYRGVPVLVALRVTVGEFNRSVGATFHALVRKESCPYPYERIVNRV